MSTWVKIAVFCLGLPGRSQDVEQPTGSTGFDMEMLAPGRQPGSGERMIASATALLVLVATTLALSHSGWQAITGGRRAWLYGGSGVLWGLRMLLPPRVPTDRTSISLGLYTFLPWLPSVIFQGRKSVDGLRGPNLSESDLGWLGWHAAGFAALVIVGLALDIRAEMRGKSAR